MLTELAQIQKEEEMKEKAKESVINNLYITALCAAASGENDTEKLFKKLCAEYVRLDGKLKERGIPTPEISFDEIQEIANRVSTYTQDEALVMLGLDNNTNALLNLSEEKPELHQVEEFPVYALPDLFQVLVKQASAAFNAPPDFFGVSLLAVAGTAIGNRRTLKIKSTWVAKPIIWTAVVAEPGATKSPSLSFMVKPIEQIQKRLYDDYKHQMKLYLENEEEEEKPVLEHIYTTDATKEKISEMILHSPNGFMIFQDELAGWVRSMNQYKNGRGSDKQFALSLWNGSGIKIDRKMEETIFAEESFVSVLGGIQPDMLGELVEDGKDDGFVNRILFSFPDRLPKKYTEEEVDEAVQKQYQQAIFALNNLNGIKELVWADREAHANWLEVMRMHDAEVNNPEFPDNLRGAWAKLPEYLARISLIIQLLRYVSGETKTEKIEAISIINAKSIIDYFKSHLKKVYDKFTQSPIDKKVDRLIQWMKENGKNQATRREIQNSRVAGCKKSSDVDVLFHEARENGYGKIIKKGRSVIFVLEV
jgi:hypothetical protein